MGLKLWEVKFGWFNDTVVVAANNVNTAISIAYKKFSTRFEHAGITKVELIAEED